MTEEQLQKLNYLLGLAAEETSTKVLKQLVEVLSAGRIGDNGGLEELGYVAAEKLIKRGEA